MTAPYDAVASAWDLAEQLHARLAARWEQLARLRGWREARDVETGECVVFHPDRHRHYIGPHAWRDAAMGGMLPGATP